MPHQPRPRFKLCETCDQLSFHRGPSRDLRCDAPLPEPLEGFCRSRQVRAITLADVNEERRGLRSEVSELRTRVHGLGVDVARLTVQGDDQSEEIADLRATVRDLARRIEAAEARAREAEDRAEGFRRELLRRGLRPEDLRRR